MFAFPILFCFCAEIYPKKNQTNKNKKKKHFSYLWTVNSGKRNAKFL